MIIDIIYPNGSLIVLCFSLKVESKDRGKEKERRKKREVERKGQKWKRGVKERKGVIKEGIGGADKEG